MRVFCLCVLVLASCSRHAPDSDPPPPPFSKAPARFECEELRERFKAGETKREDVKALLGSPAFTYQFEETDVWVYEECCHDRASRLNNSMRIVFHHHGFPGRSSDNPGPSFWWFERLDFSSDVDVLRRR